MSKITITIQDEHLQKLQDTADRLSVSLEDLLLMSVEALINQQEQTFQTATGYVLKKKCRALPTASLMRYLTLAEVLEIYHRIIKQSGGSAGVSNLAGLESALAQPRMTFGGEDL